MGHKTITFVPALRKLNSAKAEVRLRWTRKDVAVFLAKAMSERGVGVAELAEAADLSGPTIYKMLNAEHARSPQLLTFLKAAKALGAGVFVLMDGTDRFKIDLRGW